MINLFEVKVRYEKVVDNGKRKKTTEVYLVNALTFTEAEAKICKEFNEFGVTDYFVAAIKRTRYSEYAPANLNVCAVDKEAKMLLKGKDDSDALVERAISRDESLADKYYSAKIEYITLNEKTGGEIKTAAYFLIHSNSVNAAHDTIVTHMHGTMADYVIACIDETPVMDLIQ
jgi:hypothetical protein